MNLKKTEFSNKSGQWHWKANWGELDGPLHLINDHYKAWNCVSYYIDLKFCFQGFSKAHGCCKLVLFGDKDVAELHRKKRGRSRRVAATFKRFKRALRAKRQRWISPYDSGLSAIDAAPRPSLLGSTAGQNKKTTHVFLNIYKAYTRVHSGICIKNYAISTRFCPPSVLISHQLFHEARALFSRIH